MPVVLQIQCIDAFDPKIVRITVRGPNGIVYSFDIPEPIFAMIAGPLGLPLDPCAQQAEEASKK